MRYMQMCHHRMDLLRTWKDYLWIWIEKDYLQVGKTILRLEKYYLRLWSNFRRIVSLFLITWHPFNQSMNKDIWMKYFINNKGNGQKPAVIARGRGARRSSFSEAGIAAPESRRSYCILIHTQTNSSLLLSTTERHTVSEY